MGRWAKYFSITGRASRRDYWRLQLALVIASAVLWVVTILATMVAGRLGAIPFVLLIPLWIAGVCVGIRRAHDRNKSAWWFAAVVFGPSLLAAPLRIVGENAAPALLLPAILLLLAGLVLMVWGWIEIGFRRGTKGENRYGAEP